MLIVNQGTWRLISHKILNGLLKMSHYSFNLSMVPLQSEKWVDVFWSLPQKNVKWCKISVPSVGWGRGQNNYPVSENKHHLTPLWTLYNIRRSNFGKWESMLQNLQFLQPSWICFCCLNSFKVVLLLLNRKINMYYYVVYLHCVVTACKCS